MDLEHQSLKMGTRLKQERERLGLSHVALSKQLKERYKIDISRDSLINYEVADGNHSKAYKNNGMRVEYLQCFADFYGVSADWLLGISDIRTPDVGIQATCKYTELSEQAVEALGEIAHTLYGTKTLNTLFESLYFEQIVEDLSTYFWGFSVCVRKNNETEFRALSDISEFKEFIQPAMIPRITEALAKIKEDRGRIHLWAQDGSSIKEVRSHNVEG